MRTPNGTLSRHDLPLPPASRRRRARLRHAVDDRARAHAHLLGRDVLPLRVPGDLDRAVRGQRERRVRVRDAAAPRHAFDRRPARRPIADLRGLHDRGAVLARPPARRPELLAAQPGADADDLRARRAPLLRRRPRRHARDLATLGADQRGLRCRSHRRRGRLPHADPAARSPRRAGRRAGRGRAVDRRRRPLRAGREPPPCGRHRDRRAPCADRRTAVRPRGLRRRRHQGASGRSHSVQQVEFVLADRRLRAHARRLVAEPGLQGHAPRYAVHGHRLSRVDADPSSHARSLERAVSPLRVDGAGVSPQRRG